MTAKQGRALGGALLWTLCVLAFPVASGTLSAVLALGTVESLLLQGGFLLLSLLPPLALVWTGKRRWDGLGLGRSDAAGRRRTLYFLPLAAILLPAAVRGFAAPSAGYVLGNLFLYGAVGLAEEIYFRGVIPFGLQPAFSRRGAFWISVWLFGLGHLAAAFTAGSGLEVLLTVVNALLFGALAMELTALAGNIVPAAALHALFDFETKVTVLQGAALLRAEYVRGALVAAAALWLAAAGRRRTL